MQNSLRKDCVRNKIFKLQTKFKFAFMNENKDSNTVKLWLQSVCSKLQSHILCEIQKNQHTS